MMDEDFESEQVHIEAQPGHENMPLGPIRNEFSDDDDEPGQPL